MATKPFILSELDLADRIHELRQPVSPDSPLSKVPLREGKPGPKPRMQRELQQAIAAAARPGLELGLLLSPPHALGALWFYRTADTDLVGHLRDAAGHHVFTITSDAELADHVRACLQLEGIDATRQMKLKLSRTGFMTLVGLVDRNRELSLRSLIERLPNFERAFHASDVRTALFQSCRARDWRWLGGLAQAMCPFDFTLTEAQCATGLSELAGLGFVKRDAEGGYAAVPTAQFALSTLAAPVAYCAIHARRHDGKRWQAKHVAAFRGPGVLWLLQFSDHGVELSSASGAELDLVLSRSLMEWIRNAPPAPPIPKRARKRRPSPPKREAIVDSKDVLSVPSDTHPPATDRMSEVDHAAYEPAFERPSDTTVMTLETDGEDRCHACGQLVVGGLTCSNCGAKLIQKPH